MAAGGHLGFLLFFTSHLKKWFKMVLLQTRAMILHLLIFTAILVAILNFPQGSMDVILIFPMYFGNTFLIPNTIPNFKN